MGADWRREWDALRHGELRSLQVAPFGSNYTFIADACLEGARIRVVYKPREGEAPLWDFPSGTLYKREQASYLLSRFLGWPDIPPTVVRDGPHGVGTVQLFVEHDPRANFFTLRGTHQEALKRVVVFDLLTNNADRKASHFLLGVDGLVWSIDHGLTFHAEPKLRTVVWDYATQPVPAPLLDGVDRLLAAMKRGDGSVREVLALLLPEEVTALRRRATAICADPVFPPLRSYRQMPRGW